MDVPGLSLSGTVDLAGISTDARELALSNRTGVSPATSSASQAASTSQAADTRSLQPGQAGNSEGRLVCQCGRKFTRIENLRRHQRNHEESGKLACPQCSRTFRRPDVLKRHMRTHRDSSPVQRSETSGRCSASRSSRGASSGPPVASPRSSGPPALSVIGGNLANSYPADRAGTFSVNESVGGMGQISLEAVMHSTMDGHPDASVPPRPLQEAWDHLWQPAIRVGFNHHPHGEDEDEGMEDVDEEEDENDADEDGDDDAHGESDGGHGDEGASDEEGMWGSVGARAEPAGHGAGSGYPLLAPSLAGPSVSSPVPNEIDWSLGVDSEVWINDTVFTRAKAWCDTRDRTIRWPDLSTANYLINLHFERVEPQIPVLHLPTFHCATSPPPLLAAIMVSGAYTSPHARARSFASELSEVLRRAVDPHHLDGLHALLLAYAGGGGNPRGSPLILSTLIAQVRTLGLLQGERLPSTTQERSWASWVLRERRERLGLAVLLLEPGRPLLSLTDIFAAHMPDAERWLLTEDEWLRAGDKVQPTVGESLAALAGYPTDFGGDFGGRVILASLLRGIYALRAEERVFGDVDILRLGIPDRRASLEALLQAAGQVYGRNAIYHAAHVVLSAPSLEDFETNSPHLVEWTHTATASAALHSLYLLKAAGWPAPKGDCFAPPGVFLALVVLCAWVRHGRAGSGSGEAMILLAELFQPIPTAAPGVGPHGITVRPDFDGVSVGVRRILKYGLRWMSLVGNAGYAQRLARLLDLEEGVSQ